MILTDDMLAAAFNYRDTYLWNILSDSDIFAFRLSDGETGYCCVMGSAGDHLALGFYRGKEGFSTYLNIITMSSDKLPDFGMMEVMMSFNCINCDFTDAAGIHDKPKKAIRKYAKDNGLKIRRPSGWPDFVRYQPNKGPNPVKSENDARDIIEALHAAIAVSEALAIEDLEVLGFDKKGRYPTIKGGKSVPYLIPKGDGTYEWDRVKLPALIKKKDLEPEFENDILISQVKALPASDILQLRLIYAPAIINSSEGEDSSYPSLLMCVFASSEFLFPITCMESTEEDYVKMLMDLAGVFRENKSKPQKIQVTDDRTEALVKDFCKKCGILLSREHTLSVLDDALDFLVNELMRK